VAQVSLLKKPEALEISLLQHSTDKEEKTSSTLTN